MRDVTQRTSGLPCTATKAYFMREPRTTCAYCRSVWVESHSRLRLNMQRSCNHLHCGKIDMFGGKEALTPWFHTTAIKVVVLGARSRVFSNVVTQSLSSGYS